jgi:hypothetical protein
MDSGVYDNLVKHDHFEKFDLFMMSTTGSAETWRQVVGSSAEPISFRDE